MRSEKRVPEPETEPEVTVPEAPIPRPESVPEPEAETPEETAGTGDKPRPESAASPERLALRQLQGRFRKNLRLKRPVRPASATLSPETNTESADRDETVRTTEAPSPLVDERIRIEKSTERLEHLPAAIENAVGNPDFRIDSLTETALFRSNRPLVLGVTSAVDGEGKTTVALYLAIEIRRSRGDKVCLIDMGLSDDTLSRRLEINTGCGLVDVLEETNRTPPTIETVEYRGLSIMAAGKTPKSPARAARSPRFRTTLAAARELFEVIIVDMPSIASGNALPIVPYLDAAVMIVDAGVTPKEVVASALERLDRNKVLGLVLNRATAGMPS